MRLYGYWRSSCSWRVRIALAWKGLEHDAVAVPLREGAQTQSPHRLRNPMGQVPVWEETHGYLGQSLAILRWLEDRHPHPPLVPADPWLAAQSWALAEHINAGIQPLQNLAVLQHVQKLAQDSHAWAGFWIEKGLIALEAAVIPLAGDFLVGDQLTVADLCLVPQLYNARRFGVSLTPFDTLRGVEARCAALPAFELAHPRVQPDAREAS